VPQAPITDSPRPRYGAGPPPYTAVELAFQNAVDNVQLAGTLTVPRGSDPRFQAILAEAEVGRQQALAAFREAGGERLLAR
jgi:hypothetical protein